MEGLGQDWVYKQLSTPTKAEHHQVELEESGIDGLWSRLFVEVVTMPYFASRLCTHQVYTPISEKEGHCF